MEGLRVRRADLYIHALMTYPNSRELPELEEAFEQYSENPLERHRQHQAFLQEMFQGCEEAVMNDPNVTYAEYRPHFNGKTGTMSQLIQNGYYVYYAYLLGKGLEVNPIADAQSVLTQLVETADITLFTENEWEALSFILGKGIEAGFVPPSPDWWDSVIQYIEEKYKILDSWTYWKTHPSKRSWDDFWGYVPPKNQFSLEKPKIPRQENMKAESYGVYEYYPYHTNRSGFPGIHLGSDTGDFEKDYQKTLQKFHDLKAFFTTGEIPSPPPKPSSNRSNRSNRYQSKKSTKRGGQRRQRHKSRRHTRKKT